MQRLLMAACLAAASAALLGAKAEETPEEVLQKSVSLRQMCDYDSHKIEYLSKGERLVSADKKDSDGVKKLSLPILFRAGRYSLSFGNEETREDGIRVREIKFSPLPAAQQLRAMIGEDEDYNLVMNNLEGKVIVDLATYGMVEARGNLVGKLEWKLGKIKVFELKKTSFLFQQYLKNGTWMPWAAYFDLSYWHPNPKWKTYNYGYRAQFKCK